MSPEMNGPTQSLDSFYRGRKILITGGLGFIGSNLAHRLVQLGAQVTLVDSLMESQGGNFYNLEGIAQDVTFHRTDLRETAKLEALLDAQDYLFNLAAQTSHLDSMTHPQIDLEINAQAQLGLLEICRQRCPQIRIIYTSTRQVYGPSRYLPVDENHPVFPVDINAIHKKAAEDYHLLYHRVYGLKTACLRLTNTYGPRMRIKDARQTFVGVWIRALLEGKPFEVWEGSQWRDFTYVDDCVEALLLCGRNEQIGGNLFNLGGEAPYSLLQLADLLIAAHGKGSYLKKSFPPERKRIEIGDTYLDWKQIEKAVGWRPQVNLSCGLKKTLDYYKNCFTHYL